MSAIISDCGRYRYRLERGEEPRLAFCQLNASTADAIRNDPTTLKDMKFAAREGYRGVVLVNVYGWRSTDPRRVLDAANPFGDNEQHLDRVAREHQKIVVAWGGNVIARHAYETCTILERYGAELLCFGVTKSGEPKHPLYLPDSTPLRRYDRLNPWAKAA
jgi:hypothetical protein